jgi:molybdopterin-synthase adenylyltransferase
LEPTTDHATALERPTALVVGVGALGCQAAAALAAAGIGAITLVDDDRVEPSNLQRQVLFDDTDLGRPKAIAAALALRAHAPTSAIVARTERVSALNAAELVANHDVTIDATDDPDSKYLLNRTAVETGKPFVYGAVARTSGLALAVQPRASACLACAFPPQLSHRSDSCATLGILAPVAGTIGALQAHLALRLLEDATSVAGALYVYEVHGRRWRTLQFRRDPRCSICSTAAEHAA